MTWKLIEKNGSPTAYDEERTSPCIYYYRAVLPEQYRLGDGANLPEIEVWYGMAMRGARNLDPYETQNRQLFQTIQGSGNPSNAVEYDSDKGCVRLLDDITFSSYLYITSASMSGSTLDLNGHTLTGTSKSYIIYLNQGTFSLTDSVGGGELKATDSGSYAAIIVYNDSHLSITGATVAGDGKSTARKIRGVTVYEPSGSDKTSSLTVSDCEIIDGVQVSGLDKFVVEGDFTTDHFLGGRHISIRNGVTLDLSNIDQSEISGTQDREIEIMSDGGDWDTDTLLIKTNEKVPAWCFTMPSPPDQYYLASETANGLRTWTLKKKLPDELTVSYKMPPHVGAEQKPLTVGRGGELIVVLKPDPGYVVKKGNIQVREWVNGVLSSRDRSYDSAMRKLVVANVQNNLEITILENIQLTYDENPDHGSLSVLGGDGNPIDTDKVVAPRAQIRVSAMPEDGYSIKRLQLNGQDVKSGELHTITEPTTIEVEFQKIILPPDPPVISPQTVPSTTLFAAYQTLLEATGGRLPLEWSVSKEEGNRLPNGLSLAPDTGAISGRPLESGTFSFTVTVKDANGAIAVRQLSILIREPSDVPHVTEVQLSERTLSLAIGKTAALTANILPANAQLKTVRWSSDRPTVATVDKDGLVTAVGEGTANITVTTDDGGKTDTCTVTVVANPTISGGGGSSRDSRSGTVNQTSKPDTPELTVIDLPISGSPANGTVDDTATKEAIVRTQNAARQKGRGQYGIAVQYNLKSDMAYDGFSILLKRETLERLIAGGVKWLTVKSGAVDLTFDLAALKEIAARSAGDITLTAARETNLTGGMIQAAGTRPVYRLAVGYTGEDGNPTSVASFGAGRVTVGLAYTPAVTEQTGGLHLVYGDGTGGVEWLSWSGSDEDGKGVSGATSHFSLYGVGYRPAPVFADTAGHPNKADIDFVVSRGVLGGIAMEAEDGGKVSRTGTGAVWFDPAGAVTRGTFAAALGRLIGVDPSAYPSSGRFLDVPAGADYAPFVEWAAGADIMAGTGDKTFDPEGTINREQMAVILRQYADKLGYPLPAKLDARTFTDDSQIGSDTFRNAIRTVWQAGIMDGREDGRFAPKDTVTRAEAAAILRRFVETVVGSGRVRD